MKELLVEDLNPISGKIELSADCQLKPLQEYQPSAGMTGTPEILEFLIAVTTNVGCGLLASWIYERMKERKIRAEFEGKELPYSKDEIEAIIILLRKDDGDHTNP